MLKEMIWAHGIALHHETEDMVRTHPFIHIKVSVAFNLKSE